MQIDIELNNYIRPLRNEEYEKLKESVLLEGIRDPLVVWNGMLLDGHHRYKIAQAYNLEYKTTEIDLPDREAAKEWILTNQLGRRNLTQQEASYCRGKLYKSRKLNHGGNRKSNTQNGNLKSTAEELGEQYGVSKNTIIRDEEYSDAIDRVAEKVGNDDAILSGQASIPKKDVDELIKIKQEAPEYVKPIMDGEMTIAEARKKHQETTRLNERQDLAKAGMSVSNNDKWNVWYADIQEWDAPRQYDFIITDPPYSRDYIYLYEKLAMRSIDWLKTGGLLVAMCGQSYLNQIYEIMSKHMDYYWTAAYLTPGQSPSIWNKNVIPKWKPLLIFSKGDYKGKMFGDVFISGENDKKQHKWGQSVSGMKSIISNICLPGQYILDPFCGAGATGIAAIVHGCFFDGIDIDEQSVNISKARLNDTATT